MIVHLLISHRDARSVPFLPTDLKYIQMFHFVRVSTSALGFYLSNFEVVNEVLLDKDQANAEILPNPSLLLAQMWGPLALHVPMPFCSLHEQLRAVPMRSADQQCATLFPF